MNDKHDQMEAALLPLIRRFINERAEAAARPPDAYPGTVTAEPTVRLISTTYEYGEFAGWFVADFMICHGGQAGSDWYLHVVEVGHAVLSPGGDLEKAVVEQRHVEHATEAQYQDYDPREVRDRVVDAWWPPISAMP